MKFHEEIRLWIGALVALILVVALAGIGLLGRTAPAVKRILEENVQSIQACEAMLAVLAETPAAASLPERARYQHALLRAQRNVTHRAEHAPLEALMGLAPAALAAPGPARARSVALLLKVAKVNRAEMKRKDRWAQRVSTSGSWALVLLGVFGVLLGLLSFRRVVRHIVDPLAEIQATLAAARQGDLHRRAHLSDAPADLVGVARDLNALLDRPAPPPADRALGLS